MAAAAPALDAATSKSAAAADEALTTVEALVAATRQCRLQPAQFFCAWQARRAGAGGRRVSVALTRLLHNRAF